MADFSPDALKASLDKLPREQGGLGVAVQNGDVGIQGSVSKQIGKGWSVTAAGEWFRDKGYSAAAWFGWKGRG